jgi:aromatic amino acid aminotransferase I / 2-aminoadipate transaminase
MDEFCEVIGKDTPFPCHRNTKQNVLDILKPKCFTDSFSKIIAPGMRLGMITTSPAFQEHLIRLIDNSTQQPGGLSQLAIMGMLGERGWRMDGFARWASSMCKEYQRRRDHFIDLFNRKVAPSGYATVSKPQAGMFVLIEVHLERHPRYRADQPSMPKDEENHMMPRTNCLQLMQELFWACIDSGVALIPVNEFLVSKDPKLLARYDGHIQDVSVAIEFLFCLG